MKKYIAILRYLIPYWRKSLLSILCNLLAAVFSVISFTMVIPFLGILFSTQNFNSAPVPMEFNVESIQHNFNYLLGDIVTHYGTLKALLFIIGVVFGTTLLKNIFLFIGKSLIIHIRTGVVKDIRNELIEKILDFDLSYFSNEKRGDIISKMIVDVKEIELSIISSLEMFFKDPVLFVVYIYVLFLMSANLTLIALILFPVSAIIIGRIGKSLRTKTFRGQQKMGALMGMLEEVLSGIKIVKAFRAENSVKNRFMAMNQRFTQLFNKIGQRRALTNPLSDLIATITILTIMWFGGKMVLAPDATLSSQVFIGYLAIFSQVIVPAKSISNGYYTIQKGLASIFRVNSILEHTFTIKDKKDALTIDEFRHSIEFRNVFFSYETEQQNVLKNIHLRINKGETVAFVGASGSGKSTIVDLLPRFFDPDQGEILIDNIPLPNLKISSLRKLFGYVNQQPVLFNDTIYHNITLGDETVTMEMVHQAAKLANAHNFILKTPHGYQTNLGESGDKLSFGEKQRITIARAILKNPPILILDEATSALDYESEYMVREAIQNLMKNRTTIAIAHRLSTIKSADQILVIHHGEIVEQGIHDTLLARNGIYARLYRMEIF
ncbi:MAG: ABC transporter ATP-binding protein [Bacteroidales bacterium]|jgi:subfamily B ATP-binding cassette protein MsbA|nr:ABC transporter ATP-binding protein [Bacteroidales bacterium]